VTLSLTGDKYSLRRVDPNLLNAGIPNEGCNGTEDEI
jgi:hypothetical protein